MKTIYGVYKVSYSKSGYSRLVHEPALEFFASRADAEAYAARMRKELVDELEWDEFAPGYMKIEVLAEDVKEVGPTLRFEDGTYIKKTDLL